MTTIHGVIHGKTIQLEQEPGLPDGQTVAVTIHRVEPAAGPIPSEEIPRVELWADRLVFDPAVMPGQRIVKGTRLSAEALVAELEQGRTDGDLLRAYPELTQEDLEALRHYGRSPVGLRRSFGAWAEDADELDHFLGELRQMRKLPRRRIEP